MDFKITTLATSNLKPLTKELGFSLYQLSKWNKHLDGERLKNIQEQQDLKKQQKLAKLNSLLLNKQVHQIENQAVLIASELEEEKTKHEHLLVLVKKTQEQIYQEKLDKHQDVLNKKQPDEFQECRKIIIENEKKLQKILQKLNSSDFQISKKIDLIRSLRSQRGIHSNVFDKLQKEYFDVQFYYKQLLIERTLKQKVLQKQVAQFNHIYHKSGLQISRINQENKPSEEGLLTQNAQNSRKTQKKVINTFRIPELTFRDKDLHLTQRFKSKIDLISGSKLIDQKNLDDIKKLDFKKKFKSALNDLSCQSFNDVIRKDIRNKIQQKEIAFDESNQIFDSIFTVENQIKNLKKELEKRKNIQSHHFSSKHLNIRSQIQQFQAQAEQTKTQITDFKQEFQNVLKRLMGDSEDQRKFSNNTLKLMNKGQSSQNLTFSENHEVLKEMMAFFNDQLLETYLHGRRTGQYSRTKVFGQKGLIRKKHHKLSSIGFDRKVRIMRTETENTNQSSFSIRNSQCLDTILSMHSSANQKFEKGDKTDNLSIMTEDELIEESKRLIRQINKKKSEFISNSSLNKKQKLAA